MECLPRKKYQRYLLYPRFSALRGRLASPERFELPTRCLGRSRSIQLSYGDAWRENRVPPAPPQPAPGYVAGIAVFFFLAMAA